MGGEAAGCLEQCQVGGDGWKQATSLLHHPLRRSDTPLTAQ